MICFAMIFFQGVFSFSASTEWKSRLCFYDQTLTLCPCTCTDNGQISEPEKLQINPDFKIIGLSILQSVEFSFGKFWKVLESFLLPGDFLSSMNRVNSNPAGRVSRLVVKELTCPSWNSRELIEVFCSIQSRVVKQLNFPPNSVFYCTFDARFL